VRRWQIGGVLALIIAVVTVALIGRAPAEIEAEPFETAAVRLRIDLSERRLYVEQAGEVTKSYDVAVGTRAHPTPRGSFAVRRVIWNPRWVPPDAAWARDKKPAGPGDPHNPMGRVKAFFREPDYYIHGTEDGSSIGRAASHGCVRMRNADVIELGKLLVEHGGANVEPGLIQRLINRVRQTHEVRLPRPVPVRINA
jgi:lipoprotein-anchoring transpeptidase ErfK/SrfK